MKYLIVYTKQAQKDAKKLSSSGLKTNTLKLLDILAKYPFQKPSPYGTLVGDLKGAYSAATPKNTINCELQLAA